MLVEVDVITLFHDAGHSRTEFNELVAYFQHIQIKIHKVELSYSVTDHIGQGRSLSNIYYDGYPAN